MELVGLAELAELFEMSKKGAWERTLEPDFPAPAARLASGRVWRVADILEYARRRSEELHERPAIMELGVQYDRLRGAETRHA